jgi:hypothetical protein
VSAASAGRVLLSGDASATAATKDTKQGGKFDGKGIIKSLILGKGGGGDTSGPAPIYTAPTATRVVVQQVKVPVPTPVPVPVPNPVSASFHARRPEWQGAKRREGALFVCAEQYRGRLPARGGLPAFLWRPFAACALPF